MSNREVTLQFLQPCYKEDADDRIPLHAMEKSRLGFKRLMIVTVDTDLVVIAFYAYWDLNVTKLWIEFGTRKDRRWLSVHSYAELLKERVYRAAIFCFALTGCDTVSKFLGRSKPTAWKS